MRDEVQAELGPAALARPSQPEEPGGPAGNGRVYGRRRGGSGSTATGGFRASSVVPAVPVRATYFYINSRIRGARMPRRRGSGGLPCPGAEGEEEGPPESAPVAVLICPRRRRQAGAGLAEKDGLRSISFVRDHIINIHQIKNRLSVVLPAQRPGTYEVESIFIKISETLILDGKDVSSSVRKLSSPLIRIYKMLNYV